MAVTTLYTRRPPVYQRPLGNVRLNIASPQAAGLVGWFVGEDAQYSVTGGGPDIFWQNRAVLGNAPRVFLRQTGASFLSPLPVAGFGYASKTTLVGADTGYWRNETTNLGMRAINCTISAWVYLSNTNAIDHGAAVAFGHPGGEIVGIGCGNGTWDDTTTSPRKIVGLFGGLRWLPTNQTYSEGMHLLTMVLPQFGGGARLFLDGVICLVDTGGSPTAPQQLIAIGGSGGDIRLLGGGYLDVRYYQRALSDKEVYALYDPLTRWDLYVPTRRITPIGSDAPPPATFLPPWGVQANQVYPGTL